MNQAHLLFDTQYPNARRLLVLRGVIWLANLGHEIKTAESVRRESSGLSGKIIISLLAIMFFLFPYLAYRFDPSDKMVAYWIFYSVGLLIMTRSKWLYEPLMETIKLKVVAPSFPATPVIPTYKAIHRALPVDLPPPR